jgi:sugar lactone lactonase YvrE
MYFIASSHSIAACLRPATRNNTVTRNASRNSYFSAWAALLCLGCLVSWPFAVSRAQAQNTIQTVAGGAVVSGPATANDIPGPSAVVEDASGNFYIASAYSYNVFKVTPAGTISVFAGTGIQGFSGDNGPANAATLSAPDGLAIDSAGNIYIADLHRIREVTTNGNIVTIAGTGAVCSPSWGVCGDGGAATSALLDSPQGMVVDASGNVYIADTQDNRVRLLTKSTGIITTIAGTGHFCDGPTEGCGDHGTAITAKLDYPTGIVLDSFGDVVFTDTRDQRVRCIIGSTGGCNNASNPVGDIVTIVGTGQFCTPTTNPCGDGGPASNAHLYNPEGLSQDSAGNLYFTDQLDFRVRKITVSNWKISTVAGTGVQGFSGDGGPAVQAELDLPYDVLVDASGNLWIADAGNQRIREVTGGNITTFAGGASGGDNQIATLATLANPQSVSWDSQGNYYIADSANNRIRKVSSGSNIITTIAGTGSAGFSGDTGPATSATLYAPYGVAIDNSGNIFVSDTLNYVIREISPSGVISTIAGNAGVQCDPPTGQCGDGGPATGPNAALTNPSALSVDNLGNLYIADSFGNRVRQVYLSGPNQGNITTAAGTGQFGHSGDGGPAPLALVNRPTGVANDGAGNVYIADVQNNKVRCILAVLLGCGGSGLPVDDILTFAFTGQAGFFGDGGAAIKAKTVTPSQVAVDAVGNVYVGGGGNSLVRRIDAATLTIDTVAGNPQHPGSAGFGGDGGPATKATLDNSGLSVNAAKSLLIADNGNNRIRQTNMVPVLTASTTSLNFPNTKVGSTSAPMSVKLTNVGADDQALGTFSITGPDPGDFAIHTNSCTAMLAPDLSCTISVVFTPQMTGARSAFLKVSNLSERLPLSGTGD